MDRKEGRDRPALGKKAESVCEAIERIRSSVSSSSRSFVEDATDASGDTADYIVTKIFSVTLSELLFQWPFDRLPSAQREGIAELLSRQV
jgi:hypothetical protein